MQRVTILLRRIDVKTARKQAVDLGLTYQQVIRRWVVDAASRASTEPA